MFDLIRLKLFVPSSFSYIKNSTGYLSSCRSFSIPSEEKPAKALKTLALFGRNVFRNQSNIGSILEFLNTLLVKKAIVNIFLQVPFYH